MLVRDDGDRFKNDVIPINVAGTAISLLNSIKSLRFEIVYENMKFD